MNLTRRSLLKGIAAAPVAAAIGPDALKPIITGLDKALPAAEKTVAMVQTTIWCPHNVQLAAELIPGLNAMFTAEFDRHKSEWRDLWLRDDSSPSKA